VALVGRQHVLGSSVEFEFVALAKVEELVEVVVLEFFERACAFRHLGWNVLVFHFSSYLRHLIR
jgi:hypothetical protein